MKLWMMGLFASMMLALTVFSSSALGEPPQNPEVGPPDPHIYVSAADYCWFITDTHYSWDHNVWSSAQLDATCRNTGPKVKAKCRATLAMGKYFDEASGQAKWSCAADAGMPVSMRDLQNNINAHHGAVYAFSLILTNRKYRWWQAPDYEDVPNRGCSFRFTRVGRSAVYCRIKRDDGTRFATEAFGGV